MLSMKMAFFLIAMFFTSEKNILKNWPNFTMKKNDDGEPNRRRSIVNEKQRWVKCMWNSWRDDALSRFPMTALKLTRPQPPICCLIPINQVKKKKHNDDNNTTPLNNNNKTNGYSGVDAAAVIYYRRNGHGKCPAGAAANELKKA